MAGSVAGVRMLMKDEMPGFRSNAEGDIADAAHARGARLAREPNQPQTQSVNRRQWLRGVAGSAAATLTGLCTHDALAEAATAPDSTAPLPELALQPLGAQLGEAPLQLVQTALRTFYVCEVKVLPRIDLPSRAYYRPRSRYRAEVLLEELATRRPPKARFILGMTGVDISTTKGATYDWGILGLADIAGTACVISTFRTQRGAKNTRHANERFAKTAVHEIGHNLGLRHCPNHGCLMEDGKGTVFTTDHEYDLCSNCRQRLSTGGVGLATGTTIPWPKP